MRKPFRLDQVFMDVRIAFRQLRHAPGFAAVVVATLALGVGANSAVFALADAALLRPLPFADPDRLVMAWERRGAVTTTMPSPAEFRAWSERLRSFEALTTMAQGASVTMTGADGLAVLVPSMTVHVRFFDVLGVSPLRGRTFQPQDVTAAPTALVISEAMWRRRFGADPDIVGRSVALSGRAMTVIGVMPARFSLVAPFTASTPAVLDPPELWTVGSFVTAADRAHYVHVIGRLRHGVSMDTAQRELDGVARELARESTAQSGHETLLQPLRDALIGTEVRRSSLVLLGAVGFLLVMCTANLANLLLARTAARARELAVRSALGASRRRLAVQLLTESLTLAALGGLAGAALAAGILRVASSIVPPGLLPNAVNIPFDGRVALFCGLVTLAVGVAFGLVPAWQASGSSVVHSAGSGGRTSRRTISASGLLVAIEVAAAVLVVCGSGLLLRTWSALDGVDPGFRATDLFTASVALPFPTGPAARYPSAPSIRQFQQSVERELARQPQVRRVAWGSSLPLDGGSFGQPIRIAGEPARPDGLAQSASYNMVSPSYFDTLGVAIVRGRAFSPGDSAAGAPVCIVSEAFVRRYLPDRDPLGLRIEVPMMAFGPPQPVLREIVGVVRQTKNAPAESAPVPHVYVPIDQNTWWATSLVVEPARGGAEALAPIVRAAVARVDPLLALRQPRTIARLAADATARPRFRAVLVSVFGLLGVTLAMVGIFGVLANVVGQRTQEIGIRIALGARPRQVVAMVAGTVARSVGMGTAIGLLLAALLARSVSTFLFGVQPQDPITFVAAGAVLALTAVVAAAVPARRAIRIDPVTAFRSE
jgi:putative ABC transport system permease protein